eukprot:03123.XXX_42757_40390_1 [CDS] Oithona nana genome sequencing.
MYHQSVPKPWTGSSSTASWAPIRAPTSTSTREQESKASSAIISEATKEKKLSGASGTSLPNESSSKTDLEQAIQDLDSFLVQGSFQEANMQSSLTEVEAKDEENNNETASSATPSKKMSASAVQELDDLTKQLMEALDTNEVIGDQDAKKQSPFGNCGTCGLPIDGEASLVGQKHYHPKCFTCTDCQEPLGTSKYYIISGKNYCGKCRAKFLENCTKCGKIIENETIRPKESGKPYHADCFCCTQCHIPLQGKYFATDNGILCEEDFAASRDKCGRCGRAILTSTLKALDQVYHPDCFACSMCPKSLEGVEFFVTDEKKPMCKDCYVR